VARQVRGLVEDERLDAAAPEDLAGALRAPAGIEGVAVEEDERDPRAPHLAQDGVELGRVEAPGRERVDVVAEGRGRRGEDGVDRLGPARRHQREEGAEGLAGKDDPPVSLGLERLGPRGQVLGARRQGVADAPALEADDVEAGVAERPQVERRPGLHLLGVHGPAVAPDDDPGGRLGPPLRDAVPGRDDPRVERAGRRDRQQGEGGG
jgi:hypothetical protein